MFMNLHEQHAVIYDDVFVTTEPTKKMNEAYIRLSRCNALRLSLAGLNNAEPKTIGN